MNVGLGRCELSGGAPAGLASGVFASPAVVLAAVALPRGIS
jgi:hypothetical protein